MTAGWRERRDRASLRWQLALFVLLPITAVFGHKGVAPWLLLLSLPAFLRGDFWQTAFGQLFDRPSLARPMFAGFIAILFFCFWIFISGFWSPAQHPSLAFWVLAPVLVGGSVVWFALHLSDIWSYRLAYAFAIAIAAGMGVLLLEGLTEGFLRSVLPPDDPTPNRGEDIIALGRGVTALAPALFPAAAIAAMVWGRGAAFAVLALGVGAAVTNDVTANVAGIAAGLAACAVALKAPTRSLDIAGWGVIVCLLLAPVAMLLPVQSIFEAGADAMPSSWLHRVAIWQAVGEKIPEGLPLGFGADFSRVWEDTAPKVIVPGAAYPMSVISLHPHNFFLQIWLELGLPGVLSFAFFIYCGMRVLKAAEPPRIVVAAIVSALAAVLASIMIEGSIWQVWRLAAMALAAMGVALAFSLRRARAR